MTINSLIISSCHVACVLNLMGFVCIICVCFQTRSSAITSNVGCSQPPHFCL
uniref:Uncharacterized protein n=1 Tax=Arion vulgaris TaxID=1028688 RepID=A0A0B7AK10_9EUPU